MRFIRFKLMPLLPLTINLLTFLVVMGLALANQGKLFLEFQSIPTNGVRDWKFFTLRNDSYLVAANHFDIVTHNIDSKVYKLNQS